VTAKLYGFAMSHPTMAAEKMLTLKGIDFETVNVVPGTQRIHLRLLGFRRGTAPALRLNGRRVQGSLEIARALEQLRPDPSLFPSDRDRLARAEEAERWGERELQDAPRLILRWGLVHDLALRRWLAEQSRMPLPNFVARTTGATARYYAWVVGADEAAALRSVVGLPDMLDRVDGLVADQTLATDPPNAAALQILSSVRALDAFADLHDYVSTHPAATVARRLFPAYPEPVPRFIPPNWLSRLPA
jgi:glutathione S-transferase